jgi:hypothetical protein
VTCFALSLKEGSGKVTMSKIAINLHPFFMIFYLKAELDSNW